MVSVSSRGHLRCDVDLDDLFFRRRPYDPRMAYGQSKTANILFAVEAHWLWCADGVAVNALHPGAIAETNLSRHMSREDFEAAIAAAGFVKNTAQGAATSVLLAASPLVHGVGGRYFEDCRASTGASWSTGSPHAFHHPPVDHTVRPGVGYHPRHAQRAWRDVVALLAECLPVKE